MAEMLGTNEPSAAWKPRFRVLVNDENWSKFFVHGQLRQYGLFRNGTFVLDFDLNGAGGTTANAASPVESGSSLDKLLTPHISAYRDVVKVYMDYVSAENADEDDSQLPLVFDGVVDTIDMDWANSVLTLEGRDRSAVLQESFTHAQFRNSTVAGVVKEIAEKHSLEANIVDSGTNVGTIFSEEHIDFESVPSAGYNDWDLLTRMAEHDGYTVFVADGKINYLPIEESEDVILFEYGENISNLKTRKNLSTANSRVTVEMASVQMQDKDSAYVTAGSKSRKSAGDGLSAVYRFTDFPSRDPETLGLVAEGLALMYAQMEHLITFETTGNLIQKLQNKLLLRGTGTTFDREYKFTGIDWQFGWDYGWVASIEALQLPETEQLRNYRTKQKRRSKSS